MVGIKCFNAPSVRINLYKIINSTVRRNCSSVAVKSKELHGQKYCLDLVEKHDYENFLCTLLLKGQQRRHAFAIRAFNVEVAKIGSSVSEDHIGRVKLKFWFDSIDKCFDKNDKSYVLDHPVMCELKYMADHNKLTKMHFKRLVKVRERLPNQQFVTVHDLEDYSEQSVSPVYYILLELCGINDINVDHAASHLGKAQGITNLLRAIPYKKRTEALSIPQDILLKNNVSQERVIRGKPDDEGVEECVFQVATIAYKHLEKARDLSKHVPKDVRPLFLPAIAVGRYLERLRKANFRLTDQSVLHRDTTLPMALYWNNFRLNY